MSDQKEDLVRALTGDTGRPLWPFVVPAIIIACGWAMVAIATGNEVIYAREWAVVHPSDAIANRLAYVLGFTSIQAIVVWTGLYLLFLRNRTSLGKSLSILAELVVLTFVAGALAFSLAGRA